MLPHVQVWAEFVAQVKADKTFQFLWGILDAVSPSPPVTPMASKSLPDGPASGDMPAAVFAAADATAPGAAQAQQQQLAETQT